MSCARQPTFTAMPGPKRLRGEIWAGQEHSLFPGGRVETVGAGETMPVPSGCRLMWLARFIRSNLVDKLGRQA